MHAACFNAYIINMHKMDWKTSPEGLRCYEIVVACHLVMVLPCSHPPAKAANAKWSQETCAHKRVVLVGKAIHKGQLGICARLLKLLLGGFGVP